MALGRYNGSRGKPQYPDAVFARSKQLGLPRRRPVARPPDPTKPPDKARPADVTALLQEAHLRLARPAFGRSPR
jgi:hypothetical protein